MAKKYRKHHYGLLPVHDHRQSGTDWRMRKGRGSSREPKTKGAAGGAIVGGLFGVMDAIFGWPWRK